MRISCVAVCLFLACSALAAQAPTPLAALQAEAVARNPALTAAAERARAAAAAVAPAGALPDPEVEVQQMSTRVPAPFTGLGGDMMSYIGVGAMQALPWPGKLRLRAQAARGQAEVDAQGVRQARREVMARVARAYVRLQQARALAGVLTERQHALAQAEQLAEVRYRSAQGTQADVLAAQLRQTRLLAELETNHELAASAQAQLRSLLARPPDAPAIVPERLRPTHVALADGQVLAALGSGDPALGMQQARRGAAGAAAALAHKNFKPDFTVQYMFEETASGFPDRYMVTVGMSLPFFHRRSRQQPELEEALAAQAAAQAGLDALALAQRNQLTEALLAAHSDERILTIDQQGALPQARAAAQSALTAYGNGKADLTSYLAAWQQALDIEQQYWSTLAQHELALVEVTELTGVPHA